MEQSPEKRSGWQKRFAVFIASQAISLFGSSLVQYAIIWYITLETNSGLM
ncbi:MAG: MFS transporter, partial [Clostridia bacterium]|nr:MFS transporter [Clostridia bacterium]